MKDITKLPCGEITERLGADLGKRIDYKFGREGEDIYTLTINGVITRNIHIWVIGSMQSESLQDDIGFFSVWGVMMIIMMLFVVKTLKEYQYRYQKYGRVYPSDRKEKMKYVTELSCDKVIETLYQYQEAHGIFEYTFERETDNIFIFTINSIRQEYLYCGGRVEYKVIVTQEPEGCAVWFYLSQSKSRSAESRYAWEMKGFLEDKIHAIRVE